MPREKRLHPAAEWIELSTTAADWKAADPGLLATMLGQLHLIRAFEETVLELAGEGLVHGPAHSSIGQEGGAVGSIVSLRSTDAVNGSHRGHHQFLAKAITHVTKGVLDPADLVTPEVATVLQRTLAEILGLAQGFCSGRGGSMHLQWFEAGALGTNAIVGGGVPMAAGNAWAQKHSGTDDLTVTYFGDGATNIGSVLESMNLTSAWDLPLCFFIENNLYAVSTTVAEATGEPRLSGRALGFGIPAWRVDGMDPLAVHLAMERAQQRLRAGEGPVAIEALVYRFFHQNGPFPGSAFGYRTKEEEAHVAGPRPARPRRGRDDQAPPDRRGGHRVRARAGAARPCRLAVGRAGRAGPRTASPDPAGSVPACGRTPPSSTSASAATCPSSPVRARSSNGTSPASSSPASSSTPWPGSWTGGWARIRALSCSARMCTGSTGAPTAPPRAWPRSIPAACSARRSARTPSPGWAGVSPSTAASARSSSSCTPTSCGSRPTRCSTRSARPGTCSAAATPYRSCCGRRSPWAPATAPST